MIRIIIFLLPVLWFASCHGQSQFGSDRLVLEKTIPLPGVNGRIDHMDADAAKQIVYMSALGNNSVEIVDVKNAKHLFSISNMSEPQGIIFIPQTKEIMVANGGNGSCQFFNSETFQRVNAVN